MQSGGTKETSRLLITFARKGRWEGDAGMKQLLAEAVKMHIDLDYSEKPYFRSALWEATWRNHEVIVKALVEKGATIDFKDYQERTPLHEAAYYGHLNLVEYFIEKGAPINVLDKFGQTPLFRAVDGGRHEVAKYLVEKKAETNWLDNDQCSVQHCAAFQGFPQLSSWLVYKGAWRNRFAIEGVDEAEMRFTGPGDGERSEERQRTDAALDEKE
ncbi:ANK1 [Symbiodinium sp. CCMP2592]|nr:ANK1 [Symbiodinium sp. CCMP2592]